MSNLPAKVRITPDAPATVRALVQAIFNADSPEQFARSLPAQSLYSCIKAQGFESSIALIEVASKEQVRLFLDFDLWAKDSVDEDQFFAWIGLDDDEGGLELIQKVLSVLDLKILALFISRYIKTEIHEEKTDMPPGEGYFTPDQGVTWIYIDPSDPARHFALGRFLALLFETNAEAFYQVIAVPNISTESLLEEESYTERNFRLAAEGIPDADYADDLTRGEPLPQRTGARERAPIDISGSFPLFQPHRQSLKPLTDLFQDPNIIDDVYAELTLLVNACLVRFRIPFFDFEAVREIANFVAGAVNIGLEGISDESPRSIYERYSIKEFFSDGLFRLFRLQQKARKVSKDDKSSPGLFILDALTNPVPRMPNFVLTDGTFLEEFGSLATGLKAIEHRSELEVLEKLLLRKDL